jgi:hypothetical protein
MTYNGFDYLQSFDGYNVYLPYTKELLDSESLIDLITTIFNTSKYSFVGLILVPFVYIGRIAALLDADLYMSIQLVVLFFAALTIVFVYKILALKGVPEKTAYKSTLLYALLSIHFIMSTYIVRDMPITLGFTILVFLSFKKFAVKNILLMLLLVSIISSIRLSSGIFAAGYIILALLVSYKGKSIVLKLASFALLIGSVGIMFYFFETIESTFEEKQEVYLEIEQKDQDGASTLSAFNALPPGISHLVKVAYNQVMPIPSWRSMISTSFRPESYNVMNFPVVTAIFFRYCMWIFIIAGLLNKKIRNVITQDKILRYNFILAILFLMAQSSTMGHRRMLGVYPVFFLLAVLFYLCFNSANKKRLITLSVFGFFIIQLFGAYFLM